MGRNLRLLKERSWFDIPIVYGDALVQRNARDGDVMAVARATLC
jgi:hypothetical protein